MLGESLFPLFFNGLSYSAILFLMASGLTLTWGTLDIINFAHGSFLALGAFAAFSFYSFFYHTGYAFLIPIGLLIAACLIGIVGVLFERFLLRKVYGRGEVYVLLLTFGSIFLFEDIMNIIWFQGRTQVSAPYVSQALGSISILGWEYSLYTFVLIFIAILVFISLWFFLNKTNYGNIIRAASEDPLVSRTLGINVDNVFRNVFFIGTFLAALAGGLLLPKTAGFTAMAVDFLILAIAILVIGGLGSIKGAFIASLIVGMTRSVGIAYFPELELALIFLIMVAVIIIRPRGLFGGEEL